VAGLAHVRENNEPTLDVFVTVKLFVEIGQIANHILRDALYCRVSRIGRGRRSDRECGQYALKEIFRKVRVEDEDRLAIRRCQGQLDAWENDDLLPIQNRLPEVVELVLRGPFDVRKESEIVVIRDRDCVETLLPTRKYQLFGVSLSLHVGNRVSTGPLGIPRSVDLKIAFVEMCALIHIA